MQRKNGGDYMKKRIAALLYVLLCACACCALADDYGKAVVDAPSGRLHLRADASSSSESLDNINKKRI